MTCEGCFLIDTDVLSIERNGITRPNYYIFLLRFSHGLCPSQPKCFPYLPPIRLCLCLSFRFFASRSSPFSKRLNTLKRCFFSSYGRYLSLSLSPSLPALIYSIFYSLHISLELRQHV
ncbi:hypothetical protein PUN28_002725 [Cardiocondyla obscurior]|uniref:Uncharacterized protein n=1 Tax=Cardiocondyla obscurior TaxID=286306 RepID=A0AAW2GW05_9HYME